MITQSNKVGIAQARKRKAILGWALGTSPIKIANGAKN
jgi:hypothetical protein